MESFTAASSTEGTPSVNRLKTAELRLEMAQKELEAARIQIDEQSFPQFDSFGKSKGSENAAVVSQADQSGEVGRSFKFHDAFCYQ